MISTGKPKTVVLRATKINADGSTTDLGIISYWSANPLKRLWFWLTGKGL